MSEKAKTYKALRAGLKSQFDWSKWKVGQWRKTECRELCVGFNCSRKIQDAMKYADMEILAQVEVRGKHFIGDDKETWEEMRVVKAWHWTKKDSIELAIYCAELALPLWTKEYPNDNRPKKAIEAVKAWMNNPTKKNLEKAMAAAIKSRMTTGTLAWAAWTAAAPAEAAATEKWATAAMLARSAVVWAARGVDKEKIENWLKERVRVLTPYKENAEE